MKPYNHLFHRNTRLIIIFWITFLLLLPEGGSLAAVSNLHHAIQPDNRSFLVETTGYFSEKTTYLLQTGSIRTWLSQDAIYLSWFAGDDSQDQMSGSASPASKLVTRGVNIKLSFPEANRQAVMLPVGRLASRVNYLTGMDPSSEAVTLPGWQGVRYQDLYPGVDLVVDTTNGLGFGSPLPWSLEVDGTADLTAIRLQIEGAQSVSINNTALVLTTELGVFEIPLIQINTGGVKSRPSIEKAGPDHFEIQAPFTTTSHPTFMPTQAGSADLIYSSYLGGSDWDFGYGIARDETGAVYMVGQTPSPDFPTTPGAFKTRNSGTDAFVVKFDPTTNALVYATYLGGKDMDNAWGVAVEGGLAYVAGETQSDNFPVSPNAFDPSCGSDGECDSSAEGPVTDAFLAVLSPDGKTLRYASFLGGRSADAAHSVAVQSGDIFLTGITNSSDFPSAGYHQNGDAFAVKFVKTNQLAYGLLLGGSDVDAGYSIAVLDGEVYIAGETSSQDFPAGGYKGNRDAFAAKIDDQGTLMYNTLIGGAGDDIGAAVTVDAAGRAYLTGFTTSQDFPSTEGALSGTSDAFVLSLNTGGGLDYATYLGGSDADTARGIAIDQPGNVYVTGYTISSDFPTTSNAFQTQNNGGVDSFLVRLNLSVSPSARIQYSTMIGGSGDDNARAVAVDQQNQACITGSTRSVDFPNTTDALSTQLKGAADVFLSIIDTSGNTLAVPVATVVTPTSTQTPASALQTTSQATVSQPAGTTASLEPSQPAVTGDGSAISTITPDLVSTTPQATSVLPAASSPVPSEQAGISPTNAGTTFPETSASETQAAPGAAQTQDKSSTWPWVWVVAIGLVLGIAVGLWLVRRRSN